MNGPIPAQNNDDDGVGDHGDDGKDGHDDPQQGVDKLHWPKVGGSVQGVTAFLLHQTSGNKGHIKRIRKMNSEINMVGSTEVIFSDTYFNSYR